MKAPNFNQWLGESDEHEERLRELGLSNPDPDQLISEFRRKWQDTPAIQAALSTIRRETRRIGMKYTNYLSTEDDVVEALVDDPATDNFEWFAQQFFNNWL